MEGKKSKKKKITIIVDEATAKYLDNKSINIGLTAGEIIDSIITTKIPKGHEMAASMACVYFLAITKDLSQEEFLEALSLTLSIFVGMMTYDDKTLDDAIDIIYMTSYLYCNSKGYKKINELLKNRRSDFQRGTEFKN